MATIYSTQYEDAYVDVPSNKIQPGDISGDVKVAQFNVTLSGAITTSDVVKLVKLPKGSRILLMRFVCSDLGTTGALNIGWAASSDGPEAASATGIASAVDVNTAAVATQYYPNNSRLAGAVDVQIVPSANTTAAGTMSGYILYSMA